MNVHHVADFFISCPDRESGDVMTHLKLQKLLYYAQGLHLAIHDEPLFEEPLEAWAHGPVCRAVYDRFKGRNWEPINPEDALTDGPEDGGVLEFLANIWFKFGGYSAKFLENMTHEEEPWKNSYRDNKTTFSDSTITHKALKQFFKSSPLRHELQA